jgi:hypothetical protein
MLFFAVPNLPVEPGCQGPRTPLPEEVLQRKKTGFTVPINHWLEEREHRDISHAFGMRPWALYLFERAVA